MNFLGTALLAIWNDVASGCDDEFNRWYYSEHFPERLNVPGFLRGRRYIAADDTVSDVPQYAALYEVTTIDVLGATDYRTRLDNPTEWSKQIFQYFRNVRRSICHITHSSGYGVGGFMRSYWFDDEPQPELWKELVEHPGLSGILVARADQTLSNRTSSEADLRPTRDTVIAGLMILEADSRSALTACHQRHLAERLPEHVRWGDYRLLHTANADEISNG